MFAVIRARDHVAHLPTHVLRQYDYSKLLVYYNIAKLITCDCMAVRNTRMHWTVMIFMLLARVGARFSHASNARRVHAAPQLLPPLKWTTTICALVHTVHNSRMTGARALHDDVHVIELYNHIRNYAILRQRLTFVRPLDKRRLYVNMHVERLSFSC